LSVFLWLIFGPAVCLGQKVFQVTWNESTDSQKSHSDHFSEEAKARQFADSIRRGFESKGFLSGFFDEETKADSLVFRWNSGPLFRWSKIHPGTIPDDFLTELGSPGLGYEEPFRWIQQALDLAENRGFPFAKLTLDSLAIQGNLLSGVMKYDSGPRIAWDSLKIVGSSKTSARYLQQVSRLIPGAPFSQKDFDEATQTLSRSPYFTLVNRPQLTFQTQQAQPIFSLQDRRVNVFDGVIGLLPNENEPGKMLITGEVDLRLFHLGGKGRDLSINWQRLNIQSQSLEISAKESFIFRSPLDMQVGFSLLKQDSSFVNRTIELDFGYRISDRGYLNFFTRRQAGDLISTGDLDSVDELPSALDYRWNNYGLGIDWNVLEDPISPRKGSRIQGKFSLGNKRIIENTGLPEELYRDLEESSPQYQGWFSAEQHIYIKPAWGMWIRGVGGFLQNQNLFLNELYRLGGLKSIRGFNEKFFFAERYGYVNLEQRLFFGQNSFLMVFADLGIIKNSFQLQKIDQPISFGTGINLDTDGGLFSFVLALGKSNSQPLSFSYSRIHFGYLARF
jgi:outer membrane protein assembly factor BamA